MDYTRLMNTSQATRVNDHYVDSFHVHEFSEEGYLYYFKSDLDAGMFRGIFHGLRFVELDDTIGSLTYVLPGRFIPGIAADGTKDNSWPFGTGIPSIGFKNRRILIDMMTLYTATRRHVIKINFMYLIIQCKIFHVINFCFLRKNENVLKTKKDGSTVDPNFCGLKFL